MLPIYCEHFRLTREPFNVTPDPSFLYLSASHKEALAQLVYGIRTRRGFVVLTGEVGTGKTTLIQCLLEEINDGHTHCAFLFDLTGSAKDLLHSLCHGFALISPLDSEKSVSDYLALLNQFLLESYKNGDNVAVIIDEAQNLPGEVLERVRLLSNFETKQDKLLQIVLVGQPELSDRLNEPELRQLKQRVALRHHLRPLNLSECKEYIAKRLEISGGAGSLFTASAVETVHNYSGGIPRLVNILCDNGLLSAYASHEPCVEAAMIDEIAHDLHLTIARRGGAIARDSAVMRAREMPLRQDLTEIAAVDRQDRAKPVEEKPMPHGEAITDAPQRGNGSSAKVEYIVPVGFFESMVDALTDAIGPLAAFIVEDQLAAMGESKSAFPAPRLDQLISEICRYIDNPSTKEHFRLAIADEVQGLNSDPRKS